jgi:hypothetical protein
MTLALRLAFTAVVMVLALRLASHGNPVGGLIVVPALGIWLRRYAESGRLMERARRFVGQ